MRWQPAATAAPPTAQERCCSSVDAVYTTGLQLHWKATGPADLHLTLLDARQLSSAQHGPHGEGVIREDQVLEAAQAVQLRQRPQVAARQSQALESRQRGGAHLKLTRASACACTNKSTSPTLNDIRAMLQT